MKNDLEIQQDVINQLKWQPFIRTSDIGVFVKNGVVTLTGQVDSYAQKIAAEKAAKKVFGVRAIAEDIQIGVSPSYRKSDTEIAESVVNAIKWHSAVPEDRITVKVEDGVVILNGEVDWEYQRQSAYKAIAGLLGVKRVINNVSLKPKITASDVSSRISEALHRSATVDAEKITVEVVGNKAILHGRVRSYAEKEDAEDAAWCAPGISTVESHLELIPEEELAF
jgi:osmotically-inducible protein OsmY